ncbi:MAG: ATP-dependent zinc metalloprotease FtsH [Deltaproteobacteria bacterium]|nr:ATP-dependent zinc metalloprotease FtsH [Deltaproteobacteria bacterium]
MNPNQPPQPRGFNSPFNWRILLAVLLLWVVLGYFMRSGGAQFLEIPYSKFKSHLRQDNISEVTVEGDNIRGRFKEPVGAGSEREADGTGESRAYDRFKTVMPSFDDPELMDLLEEKEVTIHAESGERSWITTLLAGLLPWILIIGFLVWSSRRFQQRAGGAGGIFGFGKSKAKLYDRSVIDIGYEDVAGLPNAKKELQEVVDYLKEPEKYKALGGKLPKGILLVGPPGNGKTLMARATAGEADVPFFSISGSEFIEMFVGVGASRVRDMFKQAKKDAPAIIFIDELDSIGRVRGTGLGGGHDEREQTLNQILSEMDGFSPQESVVVLAATNRPDVLDPALVRPGRFDRQIALELPQKKARKEILDLHTRNVPLDEDTDLETVADRTVGFSGADLENLVNEAALLAARKEKKTVGNEDFDEGRDKIIMGIEREDVIKKDEKEMIAYHESGHALTAHFLPEADPLEKVSIIPRGRSLGATEQIPEEDRHNLGLAYLKSRIAVMLGGRAAEKVVFNDLTSGAGDDLKNATQLAQRMVCQWGMSEKLGPTAFRRGEPHPFLGREMADHKDYSEHTARLIDEEIQRLTSEMESRSMEILREHRSELDALAHALLEHETLSREEIDEILPPRREGEGGGSESEQAASSTQGVSSSN